MSTTSHPRSLTMGDSKTCTANPRTPHRLILLYLTCALAHTQVGFSTISISGFQAMHGFLATYAHIDPSTPTGYNMGVTPQQLAASFVNFGTMLGILLASPIGKYIGRRHGLWLACVLSVTGSGIQLKSSNVAGLYARRIIIGMSNGLFLTFASKHALESCPSYLKSKVSSSFAVWIGIGNFLGAVTNASTRHIKSSWSYKIPLTCHITIPCVLVGLVVFIPESPVWMVGKGRVGDARREMGLLRGGAEREGVEKEILEIQTRIEHQRGRSRRGLFREIWRQPNRKRTFLAMAVLLSNAASGIWLMNSYGTAFFQLAGVGVTRAFYASIYNNLANLVGVIVGLYVCKRLSRRTMILTGHFVPALCMLAVAVSFSVELKEEKRSDIALAGIITHGFVYYTFSFVVSSPLANELASPEYREFTIGLGMAGNYAAAWLIAFTTPYFINPRQLNWGPRVAYIWAVSNLVLAGFLFLVLPQTTECTSKEIEVGVTVDDLMEKRVGDLKSSGESQSSEST